MPGALRASVRPLPDDVAGRLVVADPEVPVGVLRAERRVDRAGLTRAAGANAVAPHDLRVVAAVLAGVARVLGVVVEARLARPGGHGVRDGGARRRACGDVLATVSASRVVLVGAPVGPVLRDGGRGRRPGEIRQR